MEKPSLNCRPTRRELKSPAYIGDEYMIDALLPYVFKYDFGQDLLPTTNCMLWGVVESVDAEA